MKFNKTKILSLLLIPFLASCGNNNSTSSSVTTEEGVKLIVNATGRENEVYKSVSNDASNPSHPVIKGLVFDGWFTEKEGGTKVDFTSANLPSVAYAHWTNYNDLDNAGKLEAFIDTLTEYSGTVNHTEGDESIAYQSALSDAVYTGSDHFFADRYEDTFVETEHYTPYYAKSVDDIADEDKKYSVEEINTINHRITVQDMYLNKYVYSIGKFDTNYRYYSATDMTDGYTKDKMTQKKASSYLSIGFESYFLGYPSQLLGYMEDEHEFYEAEEIGGSENVEGDYYFLDGIDLTGLDPYNCETGVDFSIGFAVSTTSNDYTFTTIYQATAGIAFKDGKIAHCNMTKEIGSALGGSLLEVYSYSSFYDFDQGDINRKYTGRKFDLNDFEEYEDE